MTAQNHQKKSKKIIEIFRDGVNFMQLQRWGVISPEASSLFQEVSLLKNALTSSVFFGFDKHSAAKIVS